MPRLLTVVGLVILGQLCWTEAFLGYEPKNRLPTPESPQLSNLVIANYVVAASLIFSATTIKEATLAQTEELVTINKELVTINKQLAAISAKIDSFAAASEKAKALVDARYDTNEAMGYVVTIVGLGALLLFGGNWIVSAFRRYFKI